MNATWERIYAVVSRIPRGRVATYGEVARLAGIPGRARQVGYALHALPSDRRVPWHRVLNARGAISPRALPHFEQLQRARLEREGVAFGADARISLARFRWRPGRSASRGGVGSRPRARPEGAASRRGHDALGRW